MPTTSPITGINSMRRSNLLKDDGLAVVVILPGVVVELDEVVVDVVDVLVVIMLAAGCKVRTTQSLYSYALDDQMRLSTLYLSANLVASGAAASPQR